MHPATLLLLTALAATLLGPRPLAAQWVAPPGVAPAAGGQDSTPQLPSRFVRVPDAPRRALRPATATGLALGTFAGMALGVVHARVHGRREAPLAAASILTGMAVGLPVGGLVGAAIGRRQHARRASAAI